MKNISLAELLDQRDIPVFNEQASLEDLLCMTGNTAAVLTTI